MWSNLGYQHKISSLGMNIAELFLTLLKNISSADFFSVRILKPEFRALHKLRVGDDRPKLFIEKGLRVVSSVNLDIQMVTVI